MFSPTYHLPPTTYLVISASRRDAASLHSYRDVHTTCEAAADARHRNCVAARGRAAAGRGGDAAAATAGDHGCGQQNKEQRPEGQFQSASLCRDDQQEESSKNSSSDGQQPTRTVKWADYRRWSGCVHRERGSTCRGY